MVNLTREQREALKAFRLPEQHFDRFCAGVEIAFEISTESSTGIALIQLDEKLLRCGFVEINDPGGGFKTFVRFRNGAFVLGKLLGLPAIELFGMAIVNEDLRELLIRQNFVARMVPCPEDLGGGELVEIVAKVFEIK